MDKRYFRIVDFQGIENFIALNSDSQIQVIKMLKDMGVLDSYKEITLKEIVYDIDNYDD